MSDAGDGGSEPLNKQIMAANSIVLGGRRIQHLLKDNSKLIFRFLLSSFFIGMGAFFILHEGAELHSVKSALGSADFRWVLAGVMTTVVYIITHGFMYQASFRAASAAVGLSDAVVLFLKRNFVSIFLPAGGVASLAFFSQPIEQKGVSRSQITYASMIYGFTGLLTVFILAVPAFIYAFFFSSLGAEEWIGLLALLVLVSLLFYAYRNVRSGGWLYKLLVRQMPSLEFLVEELTSHPGERRFVFRAVLFSLLIESLGILHLYITIHALGMKPDIFVAVIVYVVAVIFMVISPFLRGMGAVEFSMTFLLVRFGMGNVEALSVTFLYRFFEFWLPLVAGILSFLAVAAGFLMRIIPAFLLLLLGLVNVVSVLTPAISSRLEYLRDFVPAGMITASNYLIFGIGLLLLITSVFLFRGLRTAWYMGIGLVTVSMIGHLTKAIDYEEALIALLTLVVLLVTRHQYNVRNNPQLSKMGIQTTLMVIFVTLLYGITGFYFLDQKHFGRDFTLGDSFVNTLRYFFLSGHDLQVKSAFAEGFLLSINACGLISILFFLYTLVRPYVFKSDVSPEDLEEAGKLMEKYGKSALDYFKLSDDKLLFFAQNRQSFISYRIYDTYAVALEDPVAENDGETEQCITEFDAYCHRSGLKTLYYRVPEKNLEIYRKKNKKSLFLGQEGVVDLTHFSMEGGDRKSLRNGVKKVRERGFVAKIYEPPLKEGVLQKLRQVSDEWLKDTGRKEIVFSQGMFDEKELRNQTVIAVENEEERTVAFLNVIPDNVEGEGTYDLIRKTADAPPGVMDFLLVELFGYFRSRGLHRVNLGLAPLSGTHMPSNLPERTMKFAYRKIRAFSHYKGLRAFKEKFDPEWYDQFLVFDHDFDLVNIPNVLNHVIRP